MTNRVLIGGLIGALTIFLLGYLLYGVLLDSTMEACTQCQRTMEELNFPLLILGNVFLGLTLAYILGRSGVGSFNSGASMGAMIGALLIIGWSLITYATSTVYTTTTCILYRVIAEIILWGVAGGVIGWYYGRNRPTPA